ncbi:hypothetical protein B3_54 [Propionibacterium phage B3]|uniref:Uncharacterized protein n=1 Tax=Propionibacterium phage B3 TaxID=1897533 RepID=A0A1D8ETF2_9CAUD|nr:hypothetical protein FDH09_gp54 [Propionibacterium phage B3]AOT24347.1 hypothetical protein B3_54 [Propionibacterium phage B3]
MNELDIEAIRARGAHTAEDISALCDEVERLRAERENTPSDTTPSDGGCVIRLSADTVKELEAGSDTTPSDGGCVIRLSADTVKELEAGMLEIRIHRDANLGGIVIDTERETPAWWRMPAPPCNPQPIEKCPHPWWHR